VLVAGVVISSGGGWPGWLAAGLVAGACVCWGLDNHLTALIDGITPARSTFWKGLVAGTTNLAIGFAIEPLGASPSVLGAALIVGALCYGASIALYIASAQSLGATRAQAVFASAPFVGAGLSFALLSEPVASVHLIGAGVLVVSVMLLFLSQHEHVHLHEATEHMHAHSHDDGHHLHAHPDVPAATRHSHWHRHERVVHAHPHWPDIHHRHRHESE
jgi:drug/metabolite transporter (DMT)-like permease